MTKGQLPQRSDEAIAESFRSEIRARFEQHNAAAREREAAELEVLLHEHPGKRGQPGYEVRDSLAWSVYQEAEIRIDRNSVTVVLPRGYEVGIDFVYLFDHTTVAWSRPSIGATVVDGEARPTIEILLVATWGSGQEALWRGKAHGRKQVLVELLEEDARALMTAGVHPQHAACNCGDYLLSERPCLFCAGMPVRAEVLRKIRDSLRFALEARQEETGEVAVAPRERGEMSPLSCLMSEGPVVDAVLPQGCPVHQGVVHGGEAEELRSGIEALIALGNATTAELQELLSRVDARDSLGHLERIDLAAGIASILEDESLTSGAVRVELRCLLDGISGLDIRPSREATPAVGTVAALAAGIVAAGGTLPYPGIVADVSVAPTDPVPNPQPHDRDLILGVIADLDHCVLQAQTDGSPQGRDIARERSASLRRLLARADDFLGWHVRDARVGRPE